ncbi:MAG: electron transfer flavoprotein subunit alpha/FixB family protein [candidate division WOR-3 bacterium]
MKEVLSLVENEGGKLKDITFEVFTLGKELSEKFSLPLSAVLFAEDETLLGEVTNWVDEVIFISDPIFKKPNSEIYNENLLSLIQERKPKYIIIGNTAFGVEIGSYLAAKAGYGLIPDCTGYEIVDSQILFHREIYGGKIISTLTSPKEDVILSIRSGSFKVRGEGRTKAGRVTHWAEKKGVYKTEILGYKEAEAGAVDITKANIVVGVGRGIKSKDNLPLVEEFAKEIGAVIGCSRPIIDFGWLPKERLIGSSGKTIKPKVYIALGISGAFQHVSGMKDAETIIAVNKDPEAPIFSVAHYGIVGDVMKLLPTLREKIKEIKS